MYWRQGNGRRTIHWWWGMEHKDEEIERAVFFQKYWSGLFIALYSQHYMRGRGKQAQKSLDVQR